MQSTDTGTIVDDNIWREDCDLSGYMKVGANIKLISIDIFDTLLFRTVANPSDIFQITGQRAVTKSVLPHHITPELFRNMRVKAQVIAKKKKQAMAGHSEISLEEIYDCLPSMITHKRQLRDLEIATEKEHSFLNPVMMSFITGMKLRHQMPIVLLSDMYLSQDELKQILLFHGMDKELVDEIIVSSEYHASKREGDLYCILKMKYREVEPYQMLHIGDNIDSDVFKAKEEGLHTIHYTAIEEPEGSVFSQEKTYGGIGLYEILAVRKIAAALNASCSRDERVWYQLGSSVIGPFLALLAEWILDNCQKDDIQAVYPFMREGAIIARVLGKMTAMRGIDIEVKPMFVSRESTYIAGLEEFNREAYYQVASRKNTTVGSLLDMLIPFENQPEELVPYRHRMLKEASQIEFDQEKNLEDKIIDSLLKDEIHQKVKETIKARRQSLVAYIKQEMALHLTSCAAVDIGYKGTTFMSILNALKNEGVQNRMTLFLGFGEEDTLSLLMNGVDVRGYVGNAGENLRTVQVISQYYEPLEQLLMDGCGSTYGYSETAGSTIVPLLHKSKTSEKQQEMIEMIWKGIDRYVDIHQNVHSQMSNNSLGWPQSKLINQDAGKMIQRLIEFPTLEEAIHVGGLTFEDNFGTSTSGPICSEIDLDYIKNVGVENFIDNMGRGYYQHGVRWPQAAVVRIDPSYLFRRYMMQSHDDPLLIYGQRAIERIQKQQIRSIALYGAGKVGQYLAKLLRAQEVRVDCFIDRNEELWGTSVASIPVMSLKETIERGCRAYLVGSLAFSNEIEKTIIKECQSLNIQPTIILLNE